MFYKSISTFSWFGTEEFQKKSLRHHFTSLGSYMTFEGILVIVTGFGSDFGLRCLQQNCIGLKNTSIWKVSEFYGFIWSSKTLMNSSCKTGDLNSAACSSVNSNFNSAVMTDQMNSDSGLWVLVLKVFEFSTTFMFWVFPKNELNYLKNSSFHPRVKTARISEHLYVLDPAIPNRPVPTHWVWV